MSLRDPSGSRLDHAAAWLNEHVRTELGPPGQTLSSLGVDVDVIEFSKYASSVVEQSSRGRPGDRQTLVPLDAFLMGFALGVVFERTPDVA
jgi:hypothetical protein